VVFEGTLPAPEKVKMTGDPYCTSHGTGEAVKEEVLVGPDKGLANVFVYVKEGVEGSYPAPSDPVVLDQKGCTYHPRVFGIIVGQTLEILNNDETTHNVRAKCVSNPSFNLGMPGKDARVERRFENPEVMVSIKCDVHGWMQSFAGVVSHPFFSVTGESGDFSIKNLPQGTYTIEAVHEKFGRLTQKVTIKGDEQQSATFTFRPVA
jgi:plastocyanin